MRRVAGRLGRAWRAGALAVLLCAAFGVRAAPLTPDRYPAAVAALHRAATDGGADARYDLAIVLLCGTQVPRDPASAALWLALLAPEGHTAAQSVLGWQLMAGTGVLRDDRHAARWLREAADRGDTAARNNLGVLTALGRGVPRDLDAAERLFRSAAEQGAEAAARNLSVLLGREDAAKRAAQPSAAHPDVTAAACQARSRSLAR